VTLENGYRTCFRPDVPLFLRAHARSYDGMYADLAAHHHANHAPFFPPAVMGHPRLRLPDGLHPDACAIELVVTHLLPAIVATLDRPLA